MKRNGFTLIELIVVVSTIALLMAIMVPTLRISKQQVKAALCGSNIKQLILGLFSYEAENQTLPYGFSSSPVPPPGGYAGYGQYDRMGWWWFNFIEGFYKKSDGKETVVQCPCKQLNDPMLNNNILCGNYGVNRSICKSSDDIQNHREEFVGRPLSIAEMTGPAKTLLIVDSGYSLISWWHVTNDPSVVLSGTIIEDTTYAPGLWINKDRELWPGQEQDAIYGRHPNKTVNVGFADAHVSRIKADDLFVESMAADYKNKRPLWVPK
jgi:prepilin-type N-terminal cleavage/methylation domain-containing protein/prepilin-type processing-associated H-X9-DG protein